RSDFVKVVEVTNILILGDLLVTDVDQNLRRIESEVGDDLLNNRSHLILRFFDSRSEYRELRVESFIGVAAVALPERGDGFSKELFALDVLERPNVGVFEVAVRD